MEHTDIICSPSVGTWNDGQELSIDKEYYAARVHWLPSIKKNVLQVLTMVLGEATWINVEQHWCTPQKK